MAQIEPSLADLLADDTGNFSPEAIALLSGRRLRRPRRRRNQPPLERLRRANYRRRHSWIALILILVFLIIVIKAFSGGSGKDSYTALPVLKFKDANRQTEKIYSLRKKHIPKNKPTNQPKAKVNDSSIQNTNKESSFGVSLTDKQRQARKKTMALNAPKSISIPGKIPVTSLLPKIKKPQKRPKMIKPEAQGYNFDVMERVRNTKANTRKEVPEKPKSRRKNRFFGSGVWGPG
jgi:hypothetical protein